MSFVSSNSPYLVLGLAEGSIYALAALGLVVTYKTSGVLNFAHGAIAMVGAYVYYSLKVQAGLPTAVAVVLTVFLVGPVTGFVIDRVLLRRLAGSGTSSYIVVAIGLLLALQGLMLVIYGPTTHYVPAIFPRSTFRLPGVNVGYDQLAVVLIAAAVGLALAVFFKKTHLGLQMRAVVGDPALTGLVGGDARRITTVSWFLGCSLASLAGVLLAPVLGVDSTTLILLVVQAFSAATVGRLTSLPITYAAALLIDIVGQYSKKYVGSHPLLAGLPNSIPFIVLFAVLLVSRKGRFVEVARSAQRGAVKVRRTRTDRLPLPTLGIVAVVALLLPHTLNGAHLVSATEGLAFVLMFASLSLIVGLSRQVSLCHAVFVVFGATTLAHLQNAGLPWLLALLVSGLIMVPFGALLAIPAIRLSGLFLALATFGFGVLVQYLLYSADFVFGNKQEVTIRRPEALGIDFHHDRAYFYLTPAIVIAGLIVAETVRATRLGRLLRGLADSPTAVQSLGINPTTSRVLVFCVSSFLAAVSGGLLATQTNGLGTATFSFLNSLLWVAVLVTCGAATLPGSVVAGALLAGIPAVITDAAHLNYEPIFFGVVAILLAQSPNGIVGAIRRPDFAALAERSRWRIDSKRHLERVTG